MSDLSAVVARFATARATASRRTTTAHRRDIDRVLNGHIGCLA